MRTSSVNFAFLSAHDPVLVEVAAEAEGLFRGHPRACVATLRVLAEALARHTAAYAGLYTGEREDLATVLSRLRDRGHVDATVAQLFRALRERGNDAAHAGVPGRERSFDHAEALRLLRTGRELAVWFHRAFGDPAFKPGPFVPPPAPASSDDELLAELTRLRAEVSRLHERGAAAAPGSEAASEAAYAAAEAVTDARLAAALAEAAAARADAEAALALARGAEDDARAAATARAAAEAAAQAEIEAALALASEQAVRLAEERAAFEAKLAAIQGAAAAAAPAAAALVVKNARAAAGAIELDEAATRALIDAQLREAGWEADTRVLRHARGARPVKGRNLAIAEWPTATGPADYALFAGLVFVGIVEAKKRSVDVPSALDQARRYAATPRFDGDATAAGGPWGDSRVPFVFATNGRPYLRQLEARSGVWFRDVRRPQNPAVALPGWKAPEGLLEDLRADADAADAALAAEPTDYLGLREYQLRAITAVERAIAAGDREILVAMATGTGKTRTCVGLAYRLVKARRFRRILFLVDRTTLGDQAHQAFVHTKLEGHRSFADIYDVKALGDARPDATTKLQFATVQAMVRRLAAAEAGEEPLPVDAYDCVVIDESHRGYTLDRELTEDELGFRDAADYISKYRRVLDHFDAVKIGLTATPALHTVEIFGDPVYSYNYREAVIDGFLVDHEPPYRIVTERARDGIHFVRDQEVRAFDVARAQEQLFRLPDELHFDVTQFNRAVVSPAFNQVVVERVATEIDPYGEGKTLVFAVDNGHADDLVVRLRAAFRAKYGTFEDDLVQKITGASHDPAALIARFKNERDPNVVVTVDLLTTGIDVPKITTLVFARHVNSRILFAQMLGRATRLCDEIGKKAFRVFDAVGVSELFGDLADMKPVVKDPKLPFAQLVRELSDAPEEARRGVLDQLLAKLQAKKRAFSEEARADFEAVAGATPDAAIEALKRGGPVEAAAWFAARPSLGEWLDRVRGPGRRLLIDDAGDTYIDTVQGFPDGKTPEDYLAAFSAWIEAHRNDVAAVSVVTTRPRDLTRRQLRELRLALDGAGFSEKALEAAWAKRTNREVAASVVGFVRQQALGSPLLPYEERVQRALSRILASRPWTRPQRDWLERIGARLREEVVVDREALDAGAFAAKGGYARIDREFGGTLGEVLGELHDAVWRDAG